MTQLWKRLQRLEQGLPRRGIPVAEAKQRCLARLHVHIGEAIGCLDHPLVIDAQARLIEDIPVQAEQDRETLQRDTAAHPHLMRGRDEALDRISAKLEEVARRLEVDHGQVD